MRLADKISMFLKWFFKLRKRGCITYSVMVIYYTERAVLITVKKHLYAGCVQVFFVLLILQLYPRRLMRAAIFPMTLAPITDIGIPDDS